MSPSIPSISPDEIGWLTELQMIEVDRVMIDDLQIGLVQMMENAGRNLAHLVIERFDPASVTVLAGSGGNGGGVSFGPGPKETSGPSVESAG